MGGDLGERRQAGSGNFGAESLIGRRSGSFRRRQEKTRGTFVICTGPLRSPESVQNWSLARSLAQTGHQVVVVVDNCRQDLVGSRHGCTVVTWPSMIPVRWQDA